MRTALQREVDPFEGWLSSLPEWDGVPRLDTLLDSVFEVPRGSRPGLVSMDIRCRAHHRRLALQGAGIQAGRCARSDRGPGHRQIDFSTFVATRRSGRMVQRWHVL